MAVDAGDTQFDDKVFTKALRLFFLLFMGIGMVLGGAVFLFYTYQTKGFVKDLLARERYGVEVRRHVVTNTLADVIRDLKYVTNLKSLDRYRTESAPEALEIIAEDYLAFLKAKGFYDQIRLIGADGMELVRVNHNSGLPEIVDPDLLQDKSGRYYFRDTIKLPEGEIYVSPMDLNMEQGRVEIPYKPMIRFGTPIYDRSDQLVGVIILNYKADHLLGTLRKVSRGLNGQTMLLNSRGYWLFSPDSGDQWGFMFDESKDKTFARRHPKLWIEMRATDSGQIVAGESVYTYSTIYPLQTQFVSSTGSSEPDAPSAQDLLPVQYFWKLVSYVPDSYSQGYSRELLMRIFVLGALLFLVAGTVSWFLSLAIVRRRLYQARLMEMAHIDLLTGLPNRRLFFDRYSQVFEHAQRYEHGFALLYIDIDDFKNINDTYGHDMGDELLLTVSRRLKASCRKSDTVARLGGDEFVVIIDEVGDRETCQAVADKILKAVGKPINLKVGKVSITLSIGVAIYPQDSRDRDELLSRSDKAMYKAKMSGKDAVSFEYE